MIATRYVVVTRPVGQCRVLARRLAAAGFAPLLLPGSSLHALHDADQARRDLATALVGDIAIWTSPAAVRFAAQLLNPARGRAQPVAIGAATRAALARRHVADVIFPARADSEGALALPLLTDVSARRVALIGAAGGRGLLAATLNARGAVLRHAYVYQRVAARWDRRHFEPLAAAAGPLAVLLTSTETLARLQTRLPPPLWTKLASGIAVCASDRIAQAATAAGFMRRVRAASAITSDLVAAVQQAF